MPCCYRVWWCRGRVGAIARWRIAAETRTRREAARLAEHVRAGLGRGTVLLVEYRPPIVEATG